MIQINGIHIAISQAPLCTYIVMNIKTNKKYFILVKFFRNWFLN